MIHPKMKHIYIGVDTHKNSHCAVIIDCFNEKLGEITIPNNPAAYIQLLDEVKKHTSRGITPVFALEDIGSVGRALAVFLLKHKKIVKKINSTMTYAERKKNPIIHKTDSWDGACIAKVLLDNLQTLPDAEPQDIHFALRMLVSRRKSIVKASTALKNQLHTYISSHYAGYRKFFNTFDCKTALEFWEKYPSAAKLNAVTVEELAQFLSVHSANFFSTKKAQEILGIIKSDGITLTAHQDSRDFMVSTTVRQLKQNNREVETIEKEIQNILSQLDYKLETMIGIDLVTAASFIAEIGDISRFSSADKLSKFSGVSPVTFSSGEKDRVFKSRQGNRVLYGLFHDLAARNINKVRKNDKPINDIFYEYYQKKLSQGKTKHQALICVMRRLVNIIFGMLKHKTPYVHPEKQTQSAQ